MIRVIHRNNNAYIVEEHINICKARIIFNVIIMIDRKIAMSRVVTENASFRSFFRK